MGSTLVTIIGQMDKENVVYTENEVLFCHKEENPAFCSKMDGPGGH
jgi:hypothetical protein